MFRPLEANEIEVRVDRVTAKGAWLLLYKNARVDMALPDEVVGAMRWKREHSVINNNLFCTVSIRDSDTGEWVSKQDVGVESYTAKEKGEASDAFKRACTCWGIGRELYTAPNIFVLCNTEKRESGKGFDLVDRYIFSDIRVSHVSYDKNEITELAIVDRKGNIIYSSLGKSKTPVDPEELPENEIDLEARITAVHKRALLKRLGALGYTEKRICENYQLDRIDDMTIVQLANCNSQLNGIEDKRRKRERENG